MGTVTSVVTTWMGPLRAWSLHGWGPLRAWSPHGWDRYERGHHMDGSVTSVVTIWTLDRYECGHHTDGHCYECGHHMDGDRYDRGHHMDEDRYDRGDHMDGDRYECGHHIDGRRLRAKLCVCPEICFGDTLCAVSKRVLIMRLLTVDLRVYTKAKGSESIMHVKNPCGPCRN